MNLRIAERKKAKIKLGLQGPSGSGKTYSALLIANGLAKDWSKIVVIDSENSADLYSHLGTFNVLPLSAPFTPENFIKAIELCEKAGMEVILIDSMSAEWEAQGGILETHSGMMGNSFTNWGKLTPRHNALFQKIIHSNCHIICTVRSKTDYVLNERADGKFAPQKVGLKGVWREGSDYELTVILELDLKHHATASKDRTGLFMDKPEFKPSEETGKIIKQWCESGTEPEQSGKSIVEPQMLNQNGAQNSNTKQ